MLWQGLCSHCQFASSPLPARSLATVFADAGKRARAAHHKQHFLEVLLISFWSKWAEPSEQPRKQARLLTFGQGLPCVQFRATGKPSEARSALDGCSEVSEVKGTEGGLGFGI